MQDMSDDTIAFVHGILGTRMVRPARPDTSDNRSKEGDGTELARSSGDNVKQIPDTSLAVGEPKDVVTIAPFTSMEPGDTIPSHDIATRRTSVMQGTSIFGPAIAVLDPRIEAVHRRLFGDMVVFGLIVLLVGSISVSSISGGQISFVLLFRFSQRLSFPFLVDVETVVNVGDRQLFYIN
jgi:hypothetical protein